MFMAVILGFRIETEQKHVSLTQIYYSAIVPLYPTNDIKILKPRHIIFVWRMLCISSCFPGLGLVLDLVLAIAIYLLSNCRRSMCRTFVHFLEGIVRR